MMKSSHQIDEGSELIDAKQRLHILTSHKSKDIYSANICYHRSCYSHVIYQKKPKDELQEKMHQDALNDFLSKI